MLPKPHSSHAQHKTSDRNLLGREERPGTLIREYRPVASILPFFSIPKDTDFAMPLSDQSLDRLRALVDVSVADQKKGIPGVTVVVVGRDGKDLFAHSAGKQGITSEQPMTLDNIFWIASCTKMLTGVACMQLVEQGLFSLDDGDQIENLCPELKDLKVLRSNGVLEDKKNRITLRMLLSHTAGFGYTFFNERLRDWSFPAGIDEFSGRIEDVTQPLLFQPGEGWEYGVGIDWAGIALERRTGDTLNNYLQRHVFQPLGLNNISMFPNEDMRAKLAHMHARDPDGTLRPRDHLLRRPLVVDLDNEKEIASVFNSGGAGLFAKPQEYTKVLAVLLNNGTCPITGSQILRKETVDEMFRNQVSSFPDYARQGIPASKPDLTNPVSELYPIQDNAPQGWGLTFMQPNSSATGRSSTTVQWAGLANLWWWCDRERGVAGFVCTQILPFADGPVLNLWAQIEVEVYKALSQ
ncbi:beta-lactamase [Verticillium dahliae]